MLCFFEQFSGLEEAEEMTLETKVDNFIAEHPVAIFSKSNTSSLVEQQNVHLKKITVSIRHDVIVQFTPSRANENLKKESLRKSIEVSMPEFWVALWYYSGLFNLGDLEDRKNSGLELRILATEWKRS